MEEEEEEKKDGGVKEHLIKLDKPITLPLKDGGMAEGKERGNQRKSYQGNY